ncbi:MAG: hypothetical protein GY838_08275 [bacterium]|nr:hypothetical protein [bacterium]
MALALLVQGFVLAVPAARADEVPQVSPHVVTISADETAEASRDSLLHEIEFNARLIRQLRDSLAVDDPDRFVSEAQRLRFEGSIDDISQVIESIGVELSRLDLEIEDNTIRFVDERGDGIVIRIPENLDATLSEGFQAITQMVIEGLPDTLSADNVPRDWSWSRFGIPEPEKPRRVIEGNIVRAGDDLLVARGEDVRGSAVIIMGDAEVEGRVDGNVIVVLGNLRLDDKAEVTGRVVTVGGRFDRGRGAKVGGEFVLDFLGGPRGVQSVLTERGSGAFVACQGLFVLMLVVALLAAMGAPEDRFRRVTGALKANPVGAAGAGVLVTLVVHLGAVVLAAILVLTVVGLPLAILLAVALVVAGVVATAVAAAAVGEFICARRGGCSSRALAVTVGMLVLHAPSFLGSLLGMVVALEGVGTALSILGACVKLVAYLLGIGALTSTRLGTTRPSVARPAEPAAVEQ